MEHQPSVMRFSLADLPCETRPVVLRETGRTLLNMDFTPLTESPVFDVEARLLPGVFFTRGAHSPHIVTYHDLSRGSDDLGLVWTAQGGKGRLAHVGREVDGAGETAVLISCADQFRSETHSVIRPINVMMRRAMLVALLPCADDLLMRPIDPDDPALRLLNVYLDTLHVGAMPETPELAHAIALHICDLVALALGSTGDARALAAARGGRAARLAAVKHWVLERLDSRLTVGRAAAAQGVGPRYIQQLFEADGTTFSAFVLAERLKRAHRQLRNPLLAARPISTIAYDSGFGDLSYFNRAFRAAFGETPSDVRHRAGRDR